MMNVQNNIALEPVLERRLLIVDDEENVMRSLVRLLRLDDYTIFTAYNGKQGLEVLAENDIGVIISDQRMPEMSGAEFLGQVSKLYPDTIRIMLSGYTELKSVTDSINNGNIFKFMTKPWNDEQLRQNIREAFKQFEVVSENRRLSAELTEANSNLQKLNSKLENSLKNELRTSEINLRSLQVAQEILQNLPVGILGIDEYHNIVLANTKAHEFLLEKGNFLIGNMLSNILPDLNYIDAGNLEIEKGFEILNTAGKMLVDIHILKHRIFNESNAVIIVIVPTTGG